MCGAGTGAFDNTHARTDERCFGGSHASAIAANDQPNSYRARARNFRGAPLNVRRYAHSPSGRRSFIHLIVSLLSLFIEQYRRAKSRALIASSPARSAYADERGECEEEGEAEIFVQTGEVVH